MKACMHEGLELQPPRGALKLQRIAIAFNSTSSVVCEPFAGVLPVSLGQVGVKLRHLLCGLQHCPPH